MIWVKAFLAVLLVGLWMPGVVFGQQKPLPMIAWISPGSTLTHGAHLEAFRAGLRERGFVERKDIALKIFWAEGQPARVAPLMQEAVALAPSIIVVASNQLVVEARKATSTIPIVVAISSDLVRLGIVASLARPGGNVTGLTNLAEEMVRKLLELMHESLPAVKRVTVLQNPRNPLNEYFLSNLGHSAGLVGVRITPLAVSTREELDRLPQLLSSENPQGLLINPDPFLLTWRDRIASAATERRIPVIAPYQEFVQAGAIISYGVQIQDNQRRAAGYVRRILNGALPADLPIEQPTTFELMVNQKTARALGVTIPHSILLRADKVIE